MSITCFSFYKKYKKGFTLIELTIAMAIMAIMTTVMFSNYPESITRLELANTSHKIALLVREAQVRGSAIDSKSNLVSGYGVYANITSENSVKLFSDFSAGGTTDVNTGIRLGDGVYDNVPDEVVSTLKISDKFKVAKLCIKKSTITTCSDIDTSLVNLTISFTRPNPRPDIYKNNDELDSDYDEACIELQTINNPGLPGHTRSVKVFNTGFITTLNSRCYII